jgi:hypothetical protein
LARITVQIKDHLLKLIVVHFLDCFEKKRKTHFFRRQIQIVPLAGAAVILNTNGNLFRT